MKIHVRTGLGKARAGPGTRRACGARANLGIICRILGGRCKRGITETGSRSNYASTFNTDRALGLFASPGCRIQVTRWALLPRFANKKQARMLKRVDEPTRGPSVQPSDSSRPVEPNDAQCLSLFFLCRPGSSPSLRVPLHVTASELRSIPDRLSRLPTSKDVEWVNTKIDRDYDFRCGRESE